LPAAGGCCLTLPPDGRAVMVGEDVAGRTVPAILQLPHDSFSEGPWTDFAGILNLTPGAWSSDGNVAFAGASDADSKATGIYLSIDNGGGQYVGDKVRLTTNVGGAHDVPFAFSPDGTKLLFIRATGQEASGDLYVIGIDGKALRRLNPDRAFVQVDDIFGAG